MTNVEDGMRRPATDSRHFRRLARAGTAGLTLAALLAAPLTGNANARSDDDEPTLSQELITANNGRSKPRNNSVSVRAIDAALDGKWQAAFDGASSQSSDRISAMREAVRSNSNAPLPSG